MKLNLIRDDKGVVLATSEISDDGLQGEAVFEKGESLKQEEMDSVSHAYSQDLGDFYKQCS